MAGIRDSGAVCFHHQVGVLQGPGVVQRKSTAIALGMRVGRLSVEQKVQDGYRSQWWS